MLVQGYSTRTISLVKLNGEDCIEIIDQRKLPHRLERATLKTVEDVRQAIKDMYVRGAPLIGVTAALGMYIAVIEANKQLSHHPGNRRSRFATWMRASADTLRNARPTAVNLSWAIDQQLAIISQLNDTQEIQDAIKHKALDIVESNVEQCRQIGVHGLPLIEQIAQNKFGKPVNILTHCNAGWLATVDWGTATSPMYRAFNHGIDLHVWVDETRPRNQGAKLTAWELGQHGINHTVISDNTGGHLMQQGMVDIIIVGTDRTTLNGDVANKIGTYLKALAAKDNQIPFYVALPSTTFDTVLKNGIDIPIEQRSGDEVKFVEGLMGDHLEKVLITPDSSPTCNYAFDITPARLVSGLITERGICNADRQSILKMFPELGYPL